MKVIRSFLKRAGEVAACLFVTLSVSACHDLQDNPLGVSVSPDLLEAVLGSPELTNISLEQGDKALAEALRSSVGLRGVSISRVAVELVERASQGFRRIDGVPSYSNEELTRIRRLASGAEEALQRGDYPGAIRRAYYACQLLGIGL